jgi:hypothetical protein
MEISVGMRENNSTHRESQRSARARLVLGAQAASLSFSAVCRKALRMLPQIVAMHCARPRQAAEDNRLAACAPRNGKRARGAVFAIRFELNYFPFMPTEISIPDAEDLKSRVRELRRFL